MIKTFDISNCNWVTVFAITFRSACDKVYIVTLILCAGLSWVSARGLYAHTVRMPLCSSAEWHGHWCWQSCDCVYGFHQGQVPPRDLPLLSSTSTPAGTDQDVAAASYCMLYSSLEDSTLKMMILFDDLWTFSAKTLVPESSSTSSCRLNSNIAVAL